MRLNEDNMISIDALDDINKKILSLLAENSRMTYVDIGEKVNLSRVSVKNRIKDMEERGIIEDYSIIINPQKVGRTVSAFFNIMVKPKHLYEVADILYEKNNITDIYQMTGIPHLHVHAVFASNDELDEFLREQLYNLEGVQEIDCELILSRIKTRKGMRL